MTSVPERGRKHTCASCEARFYDMGKQPAVCPCCKHKVAAVKAAAPARRGGRISASDAAPSPAGFQAVATSPKPKKLRFR